MTVRNRIIVAAVAVVSFCVLLFVARDIWLTAIGQALVRSETPEDADAILVLAGDWRGQRIMKACELLQAGFAPVALVSGPAEFYGQNEAELAVRFAAGKNCPEERLKAVEMDALSTVEEARAVSGELERRKIRKLLIVTSNYHTRRAWGVFKHQFGDGVDIRMIAANDRYFDASSWWRNREGQKTVFYEYSKTLAWWLGF